MLFNVFEKCFFLVLFCLYVAREAELSTTNSTIEANVSQKILTGYYKQYRPSDFVSLNLTVFINQITSIDDSNQQMKSSINIMVEWYDSRLSWSESNYNIYQILIKADSIWVPDLVILNSVSSSIFLTLDSKTLALVNSDGLVGVIYSVPTLATRCLMDVAKFPMDRQSCPINISSWAMCDAQYSMTIDEIVTEFYTENPVWYLDTDNILTQDQPARDRFTYRSTDCLMEVSVVSLPITRRPLYYMINLIFPSFILTIVTIVCFALPAATQFGISLTIFLNYSVSSVRVASLMPIQSTNMPMVTWYFFGSMSVTLTSFLWFVLDFVLRANSYLPDWAVSMCVFLRAQAQALRSKWKSCSCKRKKVEPEAKIESIETDGKPVIQIEPSPIEREKTQIKASEVDETCVKCQACANCKEKDQEKKSSDKKKTEFDKNMLCMNRIVFSITLTIIVVFNLTCWIYIASG